MNTKRNKWIVKEGRKREREVKELSKKEINPVQVRQHKVKEYALPQVYALTNAKLKCKL